MTLFTNLNNIESTTENRPTIMTVTDINTMEQLKTTKESTVVTMTTQSNVDITSAKESIYTFTDSNDITSPLSIAAVNGIEARTGSDDNIITDKAPIELEPTTFTDAPRTTGIAILGTSIEKTLTISTSGTKPHTTETLPTEMTKSATEIKDINETTTNTPFTAGNDSTEFVTQNTISYTDTASKNYNTSLDSDELVQSSSTIHIESTEKPYIKRNESSESSTPSAESKNTKNPENQRQLNNNYTETTQAIKSGTFFLHTTPDIDSNTTTKFYTTIPALTTETIQVSTITTKDEIDTEIVVDKTTEDNIMTSTQTLDNSTTEVVTVNNLEGMFTTESKTVLTESINKALPSTIVPEPSPMTSTESDKISTLQGEQSTETVTHIQSKIDTTTSMTDSPTQKLITLNEFSVTTTSKAEFTFDQTLLSQTNLSPVSTASTIEVTETEQTGLSAKSTNEVAFKENESTVLPGIRTEKEPEVTTQIHRNDRTDYTTESLSFTYDNNIGVSMEFSDLTTTDASMFRMSKKPMSDTVTIDSETVTNPTVLNEVTSKTSTECVIQTTNDIILETSTPHTYTSQMKTSNTITDTSHKIFTKIFKDDTTNSLKGQDQTTDLNSMVTTEYLIEARTKTSTTDDTTLGLKDITATERISSTFDLEKTTGTRKNIVTTTSNSESLKKVTELPYSEADTTENEIVNKQSSTLWEDIQTSSQKTTQQTPDFEDNFSTQNNKETTRNIKDAVPFTKPLQFTIQSQFSTHPVYDEFTMTMSSQPRTTEAISDSSKINSFTNTGLNEPTTSTSTSYTKSSQEDITKPYETSTTIAIETTTRENIDKGTELNEDTISTMKEEVGGSTTHFGQFTTSSGFDISTTTRGLDITSNNSLFEETPQTTPELLEIMSTMNYKSTQILDSTSETITTHSSESVYASTTESKEIISAEVNTSSIFVTESNSTNSVIDVTFQSIDNQSTTLIQSENTKGVSTVATSTISSQSFTTNTYADAPPEPTSSTRKNIESTTEQSSDSLPSRQETDTTAATRITSISRNNNMSYDMDYTGSQFESTVDNVVIMTPSTSTEVTTNIQEITSETEMFITTTESESKSQVSFTQSTTTTNSNNTSILEASINTQEITSQTKMYITTTESESKPQVTFVPSRSTTKSYNTSITEISTNTQESTPETEMFSTTTESESKLQVTLTPNTFTTKSYNASVTETSTNTQEITSDTEIFITTTKYETKPQFNFTPSSYTTKSYNTSNIETSTNTQEITSETKMFTTATESDSKPQVTITPSTATTKSYNASVTEISTNTHEITSETEMFFTTTESESKPEVTITPSTSTTKSSKASITETSTNTQEIKSETEMFITTTQSDTKSQATSTVHYFPVTNTILDITTTSITITENIEKSPDVSTSTENVSSRQRENVDISAWTDSIFTTDLTSTESSVQTTETVTNLKQCEMNSQCSLDKACLNGVCRNPCETARSLCTKSVACKVVNHTAVCVCDDAAGVYCARGMHFLFAYHT